MSDTGYKSSLPPKSKIRRGSLQKGLNDSLTSTKREQVTMNVCSDLANDLQSGSLTLQNKKGSKSGYCKVESIKQGGLKSSDGMLLTVTPAEELPHDVHSSECHSASTLLDISNMSTSFFADPTTDLKYEAPIVTSNNGNKYFSTPMVSKRVKKKLTPVMELEVESYATNEWRSPHKIATLDTIHKHLNAGILHESPAQDLLYRSFFATECQEIVNQLEGIETIVKSPAKRKADVLDVSTIDAEPPPYDSSPMKSMLACEVANMMRSLDNSPVKEGVSFGESLLDLENIDMQLHDFDLSECSKGKSLNDCNVEGIIHLGADLSGCCSMKRQKTEQVANNKNKPNSRTPMKGLLANTVDNRTKQQSNGDLTNNSDINTKHTRCNSEEVASGDTTQVIKTDITDHADFIQDEVLSLNASQFEDPTKDLVNTTQNIVNETSSDELHNANTTHVIQAELTSPVNITPDTPQMHKITTRNNPQVMEFLPQTSIIPQDIPSVSESSLANNTQVIELVSQSFANITQDISPIHDETTSQMTEVGPQSFTNTTQVIPTMRKVVATANTSMVTHIGLKPSGNSTQDILPVHEEDLASNTTQVIEEPQISANTTQDISPIRDMAAPIITTQLKEPGPQTSANITLDITSICNLENAANTSQETEVGPQFSANTTQDIVVMHSFDNAASTTHLPEVGIQSSVNTTQNVNAANTTQVTDVGLQSAANTTQDITPIHNLVNASNTTPATDVVLQSSANTTQDIVVMHGFDNAANTTHSPEVGLQSSVNTTQNVNAANTTQVTDVGLQSSANTPLGRTLIHNSVNTSNTTQATEVVLQSSANTTQDVASIHNLVCAINNITQETVLSSQYSASSTQDITLHKVSIDSSVQTMEVVPHLLSNKTLITSLKDEVNTSNTTDNIKIPSETLTKKTPDIPSADEVLKTHHSMQSISPDVKKIETVSTSPQAINAVQKNIPDVTKDLTSPPEVPVTNSPLVQGVPQNSSNAADHQNSEDFKLNTDASEDRQLNISLNEVSQKASTVSLNDLNPVPIISKETIQQSVEGQKQLEDIVCDVDNGTIGQRKLNVTGVEKSKATEKKCNKNPLEKNEMYSFKESNDPLLLESCSMIHEEENAHDVSVFSAGSLSFVTSTPVPGFNNFQFQKTYRDSVQQDPNMSIGSLSEEPTNKVVVDQTVASQKKLVLNGNDKLKQIPRTSMLPPSTIDRGIRPPSGLMPRQIPSSSAIPSARRSLALANNPTSQTSAKEPMFSKTLPRGIPGRGSIRPPMVRQSLPRVSLGGMKQSTEGAGCNVTANKLKGSTFRTPKPAAPKLPTAPSIVKPPSRLSAPNSTRLTVGAQNVTSSLQDAACGETATGMRPPTAADVRTGLPKPVSSSIRPPQLHSQKVSPKLKSSLPGLSARKTIPALGPRKDIASSKGAIMSAKSSIKLNTSSAANEAVSFQAGVKSSSSPCRNENTTAENLKLQTSISPLEKCPDTSTDEPEKCLHQETCKCCHLRYQQLLQELEELKKCHMCKGKE